MATAPAAARLWRSLCASQITFLQQTLKISVVGVQFVDNNILVYRRTHPTCRRRNIFQFLRNPIEVKRQVIGNKRADFYVFVVANQRQSVGGGRGVYIHIGGCIKKISLSERRQKGRKNP